MFIFNFLAKELVRLQIVLVFNSRVVSSIKFYFHRPHIMGVGNKILLN